MLNFIEKLLKKQPNPPSHTLDLSQPPYQNQTSPPPIQTHSELFWNKERLLEMRKAPDGLTPEWIKRV